MKRFIITITGHVQGVGFRYTTERIASGLNAVGYVCNKADSSVEVVLEGSQDDCNHLIAEIKAVMHRYITNVSIQETSAVHEYSNFTIRYL